METAQIIAWPTLPTAHRVMVIGLAGSMTTLAQDQRLVQAPFHRVVVVHGLLLTKRMHVEAAPIIVWLMPPTAPRVMVIGFVLTGHAQQPLLLPYHKMAAARGQSPRRSKRVVRPMPIARPAPAIATTVRVTGFIQAC